MKTFLLAGAAAAALMTSAMADQCPPLKVMASVDMIVEHGRILVPVTVDGENVYFTLGTAAPYSGISAAYAEAHHFPKRHSNVSFIGLNGEVANTMAMAPSFGIGRLHDENTSFVVLNMNDAASGPRAPHGVLAADFLRAYDVELDFGANKLKLISREHCDSVPVYWPSQTMAALPMIVTDENKISFKMTLDGHVLETVLNTAIPGSTLRMGIAAEAFGLSNASPGNVQVAMLNQDTPLFAHRFQSLSADGLTIANPLLVLMPSLADTEIQHLRNMHTRAGQTAISLPRQPELVLGLAELKRLHIYIDYHHQTVYMTPAAAGTAAP